MQSSAKSQKVGQYDLTFVASESPKFDFQSQFCMSKIPLHQFISLQMFFSKKILKNLFNNDIFDNFIFLINVRFISFGHQVE